MELSKSSIFLIITNYRAWKVNCLEVIQLNLLMPTVYNALNGVWCLINPLMLSKIGYVDLVVADGVHCVLI